MLPTTSSQDSAVAKGTSWPAKSSASALFVYRPANPVGEPDAANPHVRFDERGVETEARGGYSGTGNRKGRPTRKAPPTPTAPLRDSTTRPKFPSISCHNSCWGTLTSRLPMNRWVS
jgi:hypothetical protein